MRRTTNIVLLFLFILLLQAWGLPSLTSPFNSKTFLPKIFPRVTTITDTLFRYPVLTKKYINKYAYQQRCNTNSFSNTKSSNYPALTIETRIISQGEHTVEELAFFLQSYNRYISREDAILMAGYYIAECKIERVNHDIAFCQMCLETGFLQFGGVVSSTQNNFCGLGAINKYKSGERFSNKQHGVRAHVQHLKAYGSKESLNGELIDRRFKYVKRGSSPTIEGLSGTWAADNQYATKIRSLIYRLRFHQVEILQSPEVLSVN